MREPDWETIEELLKRTRLAYYASEDERFTALVYMLQLSIGDLKDARLDQPGKGGFIYPSRSAEVQASPVRADRGADRPSDPA